MIEVRFKENKVTKNTIKFEEIVNDPTLDVPKIGNIYIQKVTLKEMGWEQGKNVIVSISVEEN